MHTYAIITTNHVHTHSVYLTGGFLHQAGEYGWTSWFGVASGEEHGPVGEHLLPLHGV